jgi:hypothetical protein
MIPRLAQCPYCNQCEVALDDHPQLIFNPESDQHAPCPHLAWVDGRYSQWEETPQGTNRMIGSVEFRWDFSQPDAEQFTNSLLPYLHELVERGPNWAFAPAEPFVIGRLSAEEKAKDSRGKVFTLWDVDGWAIFAANPTAFWTALPARQELQLRSLEVDET